MSSDGGDDGHGGGGGGGSLSAATQEDLADGEHGHGSREGGHEVERYPVAQVEFSRVETPFVIGVWILSASIAKIGK